MLRQRHQAWAEPDLPDLTEAVRLIRARDTASQICVMRDGRVVLDESFGIRPDALFLISSAGKPFVALLVHLLAERGQLELDAPVARHWPEFALEG